MAKDKYNSSTAVYETSAQVEFVGAVALPESTPAGPLSPLFQGTTLRYTGDVRLRLYEELSLIYEDKDLYYEDADSSIFAFEVTVPSWELSVSLLAHSVSQGHCAFTAHSANASVIGNKHAITAIAHPAPVVVDGYAVSWGAGQGAQSDSAVQISVSAVDCSVLRTPDYTAAYPAVGSGLDFFAESAALVTPGVQVSVLWGSVEEIVVGSIRHISAPLQVTYRGGTLYRLPMYRSNPELRYPGDSFADFGFIHELPNAGLAGLDKDSRPLKLSPVLTGGVTAVFSEPLYGEYSPKLAACLEPLVLVELIPLISSEPLSGVIAEYLDSADSGHIPAQVYGTFEVCCLGAESHLLDISQRLVLEPAVADYLEFSPGEPLISSLLCETSAVEYIGQSLELSTRGLLELEATQAVISLSTVSVFIPELTEKVHEVETVLTTASDLYAVSEFAGILGYADFVQVTLPICDERTGTSTHSVDGAEYIGIQAPAHLQVCSAVEAHIEQIYVQYVDTVALHAAPYELITSVLEFTLLSNITVGTPALINIEFYAEHPWDAFNAIHVLCPALEFLGWELEAGSPSIAAHIPEYIDFAWEPTESHPTVSYVYDKFDILLAYDGDAFGMTVLQAHPPTTMDYTPGGILTPHGAQESCWEPWVNTGTHEWMQECTFAGTPLSVGNTDPFINGYLIPRPPALVYSYAANMGDSATLYRYGVVYRGIDLLYRVGSGAREWMTGGLAFPVEVRVADLQCTLGMENKAHLLLVEFHDSLYDQHKRSGMGDEGSRGKRSVLYRSELTGSGLLYRGAGPVYVSDIVFNQETMYVANLTFECQTPWDTYELNAVDYSDAEWLIPPLYSPEAIWFAPELEMTVVDIFGREPVAEIFSTVVDVVSYAPGASGKHALANTHEVVPETLGVSLLAPIYLGAFESAIINIRVIIDSIDHATRICEVIPLTPHISGEEAITLPAIVYVPEQVTYKFENNNIEWQPHEVIGYWNSYSPEPSMFLDATVYSPDSVTWELAESDIAQFPHEVIPLTPHISGEAAMILPVTVYVPECTSWQMVEADIIRIAHTPEIITATLEYTQSLELTADPALSVWATWGAPLAVGTFPGACELPAFTHASLLCAAGADVDAVLIDSLFVGVAYEPSILTGVRSLAVVAAYVADIDLGGVYSEPAFSLELTSVSADYPWSASPQPAAWDVEISAVYFDGVNPLGWLPGYALSVNACASGPLIVPFWEAQPAYDILVNTAEFTVGDAITAVDSFSVITECVWYGHEAAPTSQYQHSVELLFGSSAICSTSVISHQAFPLEDISGVPSVYCAPSRADTAYEVRAEYLCLLECKVCRPLPHTEVQSATLSYAPIILEYDYENTDPSEYAFIM